MLLNVFRTSAKRNRGYFLLFLLLICIRWGSGFILNWLFCLQHHDFCFPQRRRSILFMVSSLCTFRGCLELQSSYQSAKCTSTQPRLTGLASPASSLLTSNKTNINMQQQQLFLINRKLKKNNKEQKNKPCGRWPTFVALQLCKVPEQFQQLLTGWLMCCLVGLKHRRCCRTVVGWSVAALGMEKQEKGSKQTEAKGQQPWKVNWKPRRL